MHKRRTFDKTPTKENAYFINEKNTFMTIIFGEFLTKKQLNIAYYILLLETVLLNDLLYNTEIFNPEIKYTEYTTRQ